MPAPITKQPIEHFDVLIVGAGISGIGAAYHLTHQCGGMSFVVIERARALAAPGDHRGSWHPLRQRPLHFGLPLQAMDRDADRHGGRDPALHGRGHRREWPGPPHIRYRHQIALASWSSLDNVWAIDAVRLDTGEPVRFTCKFLWMCQGYYRHSEGYTPEWRGMDRFKGIIVHPQKWPGRIWTTRGSA